MSSYVPPKKNDANGYIFYVSLISQASGAIFQVNPTLAAGDVKIAIDDGAPANIATIAAVDADFTKRVKVVLSQAETNGDNITIIFSDAAGAEWCDLITNIQTAAQTLDEMDVNIDDIETDTAVIGALGAGLTAVPWNASWDAEVQSECADALTAFAPPTKTEMDTAHGLLATEAKQDTIDTVVDGIQTDLSNATDGLGALKTLVDAIPTANAIADAILKRDIDQVEVTAAVHSLTTAILKAVSRIKDNAGTLETYMTNGTTVKLSQTVTTDTSDEPIDELGVGT